MTLDDCAAASASNTSRENLVDATLVEIDHLEAPTECIEAFAGGRQVTEPVQRKTGRCPKRGKLSADLH